MVESPRPPRRIIPLMPGIARGTAEGSPHGRTADRREALRAAVIQVVGHLVIEAVPPSRRLSLFDQAKDILDEAGWGLDELVPAASPGPEQDALLLALGLLDK
jgi:hypothetical protein